MRVDAIATVPEHEDDTIATDTASYVTSRDRVRRHRARAKVARLREWRSSHHRDWHPLLAAWAERGLRRPPTPEQLRALDPYVLHFHGSEPAARTLRREPAWTWRQGPSSTYGLVARMLRVLAALVAAPPQWALAGGPSEWRPFDVPIPLADIKPDRPPEPPPPPEPEPRQLPRIVAGQLDAWCLGCSRPRALCRCEAEA